MDRSKRASFLITYCQHQKWSFPDSLIYYISKNPSTPAYQKMIQSCKYFFIKNPILIVPLLCLTYDENKCGIYIEINKKNFDMTRISSKIWATDELFIRQTKVAVPSSMPSIMSKIYQSDIKSLYSRSQVMYFKELLFLATKCEMIHLSHVNILDENGYAVPLEKIVNKLPNVKNLFYAFSDNSSPAVTPKTVPELLKIPHCSSIDRFHFRDIPEAFDIVVFYNSFIEFFEKYRNRYSS